MIDKYEAEMINVDDNLNLAVDAAKKIFWEGDTFIYPTDTIYGFGANPFNPEAVHRVNEIKGRDLSKTYILLISDMEILRKYIEVTSEKHFDFLLSVWPNPLSVVLKLNAKTRQLLGSETAAFRMPNHRFCLKLLSELKMPLISTSANRSGKPPLLQPSELKDEFQNDVKAIFFTEKKSYFEASTLIDLSRDEPELLREGKLKFSDVLAKFK